MFLLPASAAAATFGTIALPENRADDLFPQDSGPAPEIRIDTGTAITQESLGKLRDAVADTLHSFTYESETGAWYGYNSAQMIALTASGNGVIVSADGGNVEYVLAGIERTDQFQSACGGTISAKGRQLSIERSGYTEWYRNNDKAIMQGMDIAKRPGGKGNLLVRFGLSGTLTPSMENQALVFSNEDGPVMSYQNLNAWDSAGRSLPAAMALDGDTLVWVVDDTGAVYPITIDPEFTLMQSEYGSVSDGEFGSSISISGDYAVVGECCNDTIRTGGVDGAGAVHFYKTYDNGETWTLKQSEYGSVSDGHLGTSVSVSGDYAVVGEGGNDTIRTPPGVDGAGAVHFYKTYNSGESWILKQSEYGSVDSGYFGFSVSISGNYTVVGEYQNNTIRLVPVNRAGAVYFYKTPDSGESWTLRQSEYGSIDSGFLGFSVSVSGDYAAAGEFWNDTIRTPPGVNAAGAAYFYKTPDSGDSWTLKQSEYGSIANGYFGSSVSVSGNYAAVGEYQNKTIRPGGVNNAGAAHFYKTADTGESWALKQSEYGTIDSGQFGNSVAISGNYAAIAEYHNDTIRSAAVDGAGAAYFYNTPDSGESWTLRQSEYGSINSGNFGSFVSISGDYAAVAEYQNDTIRTAWVNDAGAAYFYLLTPSIDSYSPANGSANVASNANLRAVFDQNVVAAAGKNIRIYSADDTLVQTIAADSGAVTVNGAKVTINPDDFAYETGYYVLIDAGAFRSAATNAPFAGIANRNTWSFTTRARPVNPGGGGDGGDSGSTSDIGLGVSSNVRSGHITNITINGGDTGVSEVDITLNTDASSVMVLVKRLGYLPSHVAGPDSQVYRYLEISVLKVEPSEVESGVIHFAVLKSWLDENMADPAGITMKRYNEETGVWEDLATDVVKTAGGYIYCEAATPGFSYFAISVTDTAVTAASTPAETKQAVTPSAAVAETMAQPTYDVAMTSKEEPDIFWPAVAVIVAVVLIAAAVISRRRREELPDWWYEDE